MKVLNYFMIIISKYLVPKRYIGITIYPFIFLKNKQLKQNKIVVTHESIHLKQQIELVWIIFFLWYFSEFLIKMIKYRNWSVAYRNISFEREAYKYESNPTYLKNRKWYAFLKYL